MAPLQNVSAVDPSVKFSQLTDKLLSLTHSRVSDKKNIDACLNEFNLMDYRSILIENNNAVMLLVNQLCTNIQSRETLLVKNYCQFIAVMLLVNQLCTNIQSRETLLVKNYCQFIVNITKAGAIIKGRTFSMCERWLLEALEYSEVDARNDVLAALQSLFGTGPFDLITQSLSNLWGEKGILTRLVHPPSNDEWSETNFLAVSCLEAILINKENSAAKISPEYRRTIKELVLQILYSLSYEIQDKNFYNKMVFCCLRILCKLTTDKLIMTESPNSVGEILGVVKAFLFHGIKGYSSIKPQCLRPAAMNLPEAVHGPPRGRNLRNKTKSKRQASKKVATEEKSASQFSVESLTNCCKYSSDSETEIFNPAQTESKVRLEAIRLLHVASQEISPREFFGYWPQIVASGSRDSARVLTRSVLKEPVSKVRQNVLGTLSKLLISAKHFLVHADDSEHPSFLTFFGTVGAMIRELHFTLALVLSYERNVLVLTHALKCAAGLVQGTPYARLRSGLATKLSRNCRPHMLHKDPTVRVSALTVFEAFASLDSLTPEILNILGKQSKILITTDMPQLNISATSGGDDEEQDENEYEFTELSYDESEIDSEADDMLCREKGVSSLLQICLNNISNESERGPVRLEALKLLGALAFNVESLVFAHLEVVTATLAAAGQETEVQVARHACRVIETIAGRLANSCPENVSISAFWNAVFIPVTSLVQNSQTTLREAACDCLGNIGATMFSQLSRERSILIITILFGAARDDESAVRAAAIRALGMLVTLPPLEEDTGFLMDLVDIVCLAIDDSNLGVRVKAAWALANLCNCLINHEENEEAEPVPLDILLPRLYTTTVKAAEDNCKVKCNAVRAVGSVIRLCSDRQVLKDASQGLDVLIKCATLENDMKVRWNACRALGFVINYKPDAILPSSWRDQVFPTLCILVCQSPNFKVRTNAAWALSSCESYGKYIPSLWKSVVVALENSQHVPSFVEYPHRDVLVQQLCLTLSHLASRTDASDLQSVWSEIRDYLDDIAKHMRHLHDRVLPEKAGDLVTARTHLQKLNQIASNPEDRLVAKTLADLFERTNLYDEFGSIANKN